MNQQKVFQGCLKKFLLIVLPCRVSCDVRGVLYGHTVCAGWGSSFAYGRGVTAPSPLIGSFPLAHLN